MKLKELVYISKDMVNSTVEATGGIYFHFNESGYLIYLGLATNLRERLYQHLRGSHGEIERHKEEIEYFGYFIEEDAQERIRAEKKLIRELLPLYNQAYVEKVPFVERIACQERLKAQGHIYFKNITGFLNWKDDISFDAYIEANNERILDAREAEKRAIEWEELHDGIVDIEIPTPQEMEMEYIEELIEQLQTVKSDEEELEIKEELSEVIKYSSLDTDTVEYIIKKYLRDTHYLYENT